jgi:K+-sensing histidine kinase KdpD
MLYLLAPGWVVAVAGEVQERLQPIRVRNTGEGIASEKLLCTWQRFYQGEQYAHQKSGAGLVLTLAMEWIEEIGGSVAVESVMGQDSCLFYAYLALSLVRLDDREDNQPGYFQNL